MSNENNMDNKDNMVYKNNINGVPVAGWNKTAVRLDLKKRYCAGLVKVLLRRPRRAPYLVRKLLTDWNHERPGS